LRSVTQSASPSPARRAWGSLSQAEIVAAALDIARSEGMAALTIRRLASELGASRMALYRHVADKEALVDLVLNAIAEHDVVPPDIEDGPWQDRLRRLAAGIRRELLTYPGMTDVLISRSYHGPGALHLVETILQVLADAGLDERRSARLYLVFIDLVLGRLHRELHADPVGHHRNANIVAVSERTGGHPRLHAVEPYLRDVTPADVLEAELDMFILAVETAAAGDDST
jgi:TetR/AcrR family tetracycline transcriptional repressor